MPQCIIHPIDTLQDALLADNHKNPTHIFFVTYACDLRGLMRNIKIYYLNGHIINSITTTPNPKESLDEHVARQLCFVAAGVTPIDYRGENDRDKRAAIKQEWLNHIFQTMQATIGGAQCDQKSTSPTTKGVDFFPKTDRPRSNAITERPDASSGAMMQYKQP